VTNFPPFSNLSALALQLEGSGKYPKLSIKLRQAWRAQSCLADLTQSQECCEALRGTLDRPRSDDTPTLLTTERALLTTAVILYARATSTSGQGGERGSIQLDRNKLTDDEWKNHNALLDVRNQALAHVYSTRKVNSHEWHREMFFAVEVNDGAWKPASATNQTGFQAATLEYLENMLPVANKLLLEKFRKNMAAVTDQIKQVPQSLLLEHRFDPVTVFGSIEAVRHLLAGASQETASFWVNEGADSPGPLASQPKGRPKRPDL
jgi:uncharacterized coiled-coil protein SlyX